MVWESREPGRRTRPSPSVWSQSIITDRRRRLEGGCCSRGVPAPGRGRVAGSGGGVGGGTEAGGEGKRRL